MMKMDKLLRSEIDKRIETLVENNVKVESYILTICHSAWEKLGKPKQYESKYGTIPIHVSESEIQ